MIDVVQTANDIANYKINNRITENSHENFIQILWNSYSYRLPYSLSASTIIDLNHCREYLSKLNLDDIYSLAECLNLYVVSSPTLILYYLSGYTLLSHHISVVTQKFDLSDFKDYMIKNINDTFLLYQINVNSADGYIIRYKQIKVDYSNIVSLPKSRKRLLWLRKLKLNQINDKL